MVGALHRLDGLAVDQVVGELDGLVVGDGRTLVGLLGQTVGASDDGGCPREGRGPSQRGGTHHTVVRDAIKSTGNNGTARQHSATSNHGVTAKRMGPGHRWVDEINYEKLGRDRQWVF